MQPHQQRVVDERAELGQKVSALARFISIENPVYMALPERDRDLLQDQLTVMLEYIDILDARIERFI